MIADTHGGGSLPLGTPREKGKRGNDIITNMLMVLLATQHLPSARGVVTFGSDEDSCSQHTPYCETRHGSNPPSEPTRFHFHLPRIIYL